MMMSKSGNGLIPSPLVAGAELLLLAAAAAAAAAAALSPTTPTAIFGIHSAAKSARLSRCSPPNRI
jgi:hypothetical protein